MVKCPYDSATEIICCTIGIMVIQWGYIEEFINQCVLLLYHTCKGKNTKTCQKSGMPRTQFSRKLEFLTEILEAPLLSKYRNEGLGLICRTELLSKYRDTIIHSAMIELKPDSFKLSKYQYDKNAKKINIPNLDHSEYTLDDLSQFRKMFQALASDLAPFVDRLVKDFAK